MLGTSKQLQNFFLARVSSGSQVWLGSNGWAGRFPNYIRALRCLINNSRGLLHYAISNILGLSGNSTVGYGTLGWRKDSNSFSAPLLFAVPLLFLFLVLDRVGLGLGVGNVGRHRVLSIGELVIQLVFLGVTRIELLSLLGFLFLLLEGSVGRAAAGEGKSRGMSSFTSLVFGYPVHWVLGISKYKWLINGNIIQINSLAILTHNNLIIRGPVRCSRLIQLMEPLIFCSLVPSVGHGKALYLTNSTLANYISLHNLLRTLNLSKSRC